MSHLLVEATWVPSSWHEEHLLLLLLHASSSWILSRVGVKGVVYWNLNEQEFMTGVSGLRLHIYNTWQKLRFTIARFVSFRDVGHTLFGLERTATLMKSRLRNRLKNMKTPCALNNEHLWEFFMTVGLHEESTSKAPACTGISIFPHPTARIQPPGTHKFHWGQAGKHLLGKHQLRVFDHPARGWRCESSICGSRPCQRFLRWCSW